MGDESHWGDSARYVRSREVAVKVGCRHSDRRAADLLMRELSGVGLGAPPGFCAFAGTRPKSSPVIRLFSALVDRSLADIKIHTADQVLQSTMSSSTSAALRQVEQIAVPSIATQAAGDTTVIEVPLERLAWARSGDKGDKANIGVMARHPDFLPWIAAVLTEEYVAIAFCALYGKP